MKPDKMHKQEEMKPGEPGGKPMEHVRLLDMEDPLNIYHDETGWGATIIEVMTYRPQATFIWIVRKIICPGCSRSKTG
ncbi:MAG: hypothetical protein MI975_27505 [Cytophagales bacterium]|nr:hypothetical protein [Cytophagales bacterium]